MTPKAQAVANLIRVAEAVPVVLQKISRAHEDRLERLGVMQERLEVWMLGKRAAAESLGPAQDTQHVEAAQAPQAQKKTLQELMGTPDVQKWFRGSVGGLAKRGDIPYALMSPDQEPQTNMDHEQLKAILQKYLAAQG